MISGTLLKPHKWLTESVVSSIIHYYKQRKSHMAEIIENIIVGTIILFVVIGFTGNMWFLIEKLRGK